MLQRFQRETDAASSGSEPVRLVLTLEVQGEVAADAAEGDVLELGEISGSEAGEGWLGLGDWSPARLLMLAGDRKSTRLNSSHVAISYAVFCLKKKKPNTGSWLRSNR